MAGHSHSANIARRKNAVDAKRAKIFSKCSKALMSAVRQGGPDPDANLKLKYAIDDAKAENMPKDNIQRAIKSASGDKGGTDFEELVYEGYGPSGVAIVITALTDNRHRTSADLRHLLEKRGGNLGTPGSVAFLFDFRGIVTVERGERSEDELTEVALELGADDVVCEAEYATFYGKHSEFLNLKAGVEAAGLAIASSEMGYVPLTLAPVTDKEDARRVFKLIEALEDNDDVQKVYANYEVDPTWLDELSA